MRMTHHFDCTGPRRTAIEAIPPHLFGPPREPEDDELGPRSSIPNPIEREDLPYKVELWDTAKASVEQVLAVTANASIGFAALYGATREFPDRYITLRHKTTILSRWNAPRH